jgi:hypothetical protein
VPSIALIGFNRAAAALLVAAQDGGINGPTHRPESAGYSCDVGSSQLQLRPGGALLAPLSGRTSPSSLFSPPTVHLSPLSPSPRFDSRPLQMSSNPALSMPPISSSHSERSPQGDARWHPLRRRNQRAFYSRPQASRSKGFRAVNPAVLVLAGVHSHIRRLAPTTASTR